MHRTLVFNGDPTTLANIGRDIAGVERVIAVTLHRGASLKPPGDQLTVQVLNAHADDVVRRATPALDAGIVTMVIAESSALVDSPRSSLIDRDADEMLWEEMESGLRNHGRLSVNYLLLMSLGGIIASLAWAAHEPVDQTIGFVASSIIAPGFEPIAKVAQGIVLRRMKMVSRGALAILVGYVVLIAAAAATFALAGAAEPSVRAHLIVQPPLDGLTGFGLRPLLTTAAAAVAGAMMVASLRDLYVTGPLLALVLVPDTALVGAAFVAGEPALAGKSALRVLADVGMVVLFGCVVFLWKQVRFHRRRIVG